MEFHEKLQQLRKQKQLTQEELAQVLYVSRTAISKWESGRGYPSIDSLKAISQFFGVSLDDLLSGKEALNAAEADLKAQKHHFCDLVFGLLDCGFLLVLFLPLFGQPANDFVQSVSLLSVHTITPGLKAIYLVLLFSAMLTGFLTLIVENCHSLFWQKHKRLLSVGLNTSIVLAMMLSRQPYAAVFAFVFLFFKVLLVLKHR